MSGWYYGKTAGLLGTYNYEEHDEFERPTGVTFNSVYSKKWELGNGCRTPNFDVEPKTQIDENSDYFKICKKHFGLQSSPLSACFEEVSIFQISACVFPRKKPILAIMRSNVLPKLLLSEIPPMKYQHSLNINLCLKY